MTEQSDRIAVKELDGGYTATLWPQEDGTFAVQVEGLNLSATLRGYTGVEYAVYAAKKMIEFMATPISGVTWVVLEEFTSGGGFPLVAFDDRDTAQGWADKQPATVVTKGFKVIPLALNPADENVLANGESVWRLFLAPKRIDVERRPASDVSYVYASQEFHSDEDEDARGYDWPRIVFVFAVDESEAIQQALEMRRRWMGWGE